MKYKTCLLSQGHYDSDLKMQIIILLFASEVCIYVGVEKLLNSSGRELRRALFSLKQVFQVCSYRHHSEHVYVVNFIDMSDCHKKTCKVSCKNFAVVIMVIDALSD
jgi:hypothetical protein